MRSRHTRAVAVGTVVTVAALVATACTGGSGHGGGKSATTTRPPSQAAGIQAIRHIVVIMQENRSFDSYFGTFPGADGIPMRDSVPTVCIPDPARGSCARPSVDHADVNGGGPHSEANAVADVNGGKMDGFIGQAESGR